MCYSIDANQNPRDLAHSFRALVDYQAYETLFRARLNSSRFVLPPGMEIDFLNPKTSEEQEIQKLVLAYYDQARATLSTKIDEYRVAVATLENKLATKETKTARESLEAKQRQLVRFTERRENLKPGNDSGRIFPRHYTSAIVQRANGLVVEPVRYGVFRQTGALINDILNDDASDYGLYNCRRDSLDAARFMEVQKTLLVRAKDAKAKVEKQYQELWLNETTDKKVLATKEKVRQFLIDMDLPESALEPRTPVTQSIWQPLVRQHKAIIVARSFYENVYVHDFEQRRLDRGEKPRSMVIQFSPEPATELCFPCLLSEVTFGKSILQGVTVITDEPNVEVAARGHDRTPITLTADAAREFLSDGADTLQKLQRLLDEKKRRFFFEALAA